MPSNAEQGSTDVDKAEEKKPLALHEWMATEFCIGDVRNVIAQTKEESELDK